MQVLGAFMGFFLLASAAAAAAPAQASSTGALPAQPEPPPSLSVAMTAYNAVPDQTDSSPNITASGAYSNPQVVAARSQDLAAKLPYGTIIKITGPASPSGTCGYKTVKPLIGYRVVADAMNVRYTDRIDILFGTKQNYILGNGHVMNASNILGLCHGVKVTIVGHIDLKNPANLPKTQAALAAIVQQDATVN